MARLTFSTLPRSAVMATPLAIPGAYVVPLDRRPDTRGNFLKVFQSPSLQALGISCPFVECYVTTSFQGVIRGLHVQAPPHEHDKLVCCIAGRIADVLLDVRVGSPAFGRHVAFEMTGDHPVSVIIPRGVAHGFECLSEEAVLVYLTSSVHVPDADVGIRWDSIAAPWLTHSPIVSDRDRSFPPLDGFASPFRFSCLEDAP